MKEQIMLLVILFSIIVGCKKKEPPEEKLIKDFVSAMFSDEPDLAFKIQTLEFKNLIHGKDSLDYQYKIYSEDYIKRFSEDPYKPRFTNLWTVDSLMAEYSREMNSLKKPIDNLRQIYSKALDRFNERKDASSIEEVERVKQKILPLLNQAYSRFNCDSINLSVLSNFSYYKDSVIGMSYYCSGYIFDPTGKHGNAKRMINKIYILSPGKTKILRTEDLK